MSRELNRETGTWMPLFTDNFIFSSPWEWMQPGASVDYAYGLDAPLRFDEGTHERVLASHWGNPIARRSDSIIQVDTRMSASSLQTATGFDSRDDRDRSSMCIHATSAFDMMDRMKFRVAVQSSALPETIAFSGPGALVKVRVDATQEVSLTGVAYREGAVEFSLNDVCETIEVSSRPLSWHSTWSDCVIDLSNVNTNQQSSVPWDTVCFLVRPGVELFVDQVATELRGFFENEDIQRGSAGNAPPMADADSSAEAIINEFLRENGLILVDGKIVVITQNEGGASSFALPSPPPPPPPLQNPSSIDAQLLDFLNSQGLMLTSSGTIVSMASMIDQPAPFEQAYLPPAMSSPTVASRDQTHQVGSVLPTAPTGFECWITQDICRQQPGNYGT